MDSHIAHPMTMNEVAFFFQILFPPICSMRFKRTKPSESWNTSRCVICHIEAKNKLNAE